MPKRIDRSLALIAACIIFMTGTTEAGSRLYDMSIYLSPDSAQYTGARGSYLVAAQNSSNPAGAREYQIADRGPSSDSGPKPLGGILSEVRFGVLKHDFGPFSSSEEEGVDVNLEALFVSPGFLEFIGAPRPHLGLTANTSGDTSQAYFGLSWEFDIWKDLFAGFSFGGSYHDGETTTDRSDKKELGCSLLFRESIEVGYRFGGHHAITAFLDHVSNANICDKNEGLENLGIRYGYRF
jgi:lipid A 3-O-deacylase